MNLAIVFAFLMVIAIVAYLRYLSPYLRVKGLDYYSEVRLALMLTGYVFREKKVKDIARVALLVVTELEELSISPEEKHVEGVERLSIKLLEEFNLELEEGALDLLIQVAVAMLPKTNIE